ncbi:hypothetical protein [Anaerostipes sp.]|uniref:hypothetical protein n=1 Tax=Anaerostipes sp. TaxID=1872530 RepID=UPI0025BC2716|nr:hypothetical protein [Anaerostipes sp.]
MKKRWKQLAGILLSAVIAAGSFGIPVSAKDKTDWKDFLSVNGEKIFQKGKKVSGKNQAEIHVKRYNSLAVIPDEDGYVYNSAWQGKTVKIYADQAGVLMIAGESDDDVEAFGTLYDASGKEVREYRKQGGLIKSVPAGTVYSLKLPDKCKSFTVEAILTTDHVKTIKPDDLYLQTGSGNYFHHEFTVKKRALVTQPSLPLSGQRLSYNVQKKTKSGWKKLSKVKSAAASDEKALVQSIYGLSKGSYRVAVKIKSGEPYIVGYSTAPIPKKYKTKKSKAKKISLYSQMIDLYTDTEKASRWYRVNRKTAKKKRYIETAVVMNSGRLKISIYKKGRKKPLKTYKLSGQKEKRYRLKNGAGTYYIKVSKIGKNTNGVYSIDYN